MHADPIKSLVEQLTRLPGVGERTALRLTLHLISKEKQHIADLAAALHQVAERVRECEQCFSLTCDDNKCAICRSHTRDSSVVCVVASMQDQMAIESTGDYRGLYHVLHGTLAPMEGIGPQHLRMSQLWDRMLAQDSLAKEVIIATPPTIEGEATALYIADRLQDTGVTLTRIASGVPVGGDLQFADRVTLSRAMMQRRGMI